MGATVTVEGAAELSRSLDRAADDLGRLDESAHDAAERVVNLARGRAPRASGTLRSRIVGSVDATGATVTAEARYSAYVEYGTSRMSARPYLVPALDASQSQIVDSYGREVGQAISRVKGR